MKYNTKPIDFTGCHLVIAEHLKRGEAIECMVWDEEGESKVKAWVYSYVQDTAYKYKIKGGGYACAKPISSKVRRIMPPERAIPTLIARGWRYNENGALLGDPLIIPQMFKEMGGPIDNSLAVWPACIIEEVEDDE